MKQSVERLEKTLARVAKEQGLAQERLRRWVSFLALCGVLERAVKEGILAAALILQVVRDELAKPELLIQRPHQQQADVGSDA